MNFQSFMESFSPVVFAMFFRSLGAIIFLPLLGFNQGILNKTILSLILTYYCWEAGGINSLDYGVITCLQQLLIGIGLSLPIVLTLNLYYMLAELIEVGRGQSLANFYDPNVGDNNQILVTIAKYYLWAKLLTLGVFDSLIVALKNSFELNPVGSRPISYYQVAIQYTNQVSDFMINLFLLYLPFALISLLVDLVVAFLGKVMPQVNLFSDSFIFKSYLKLTIFIHFSIDSSLIINLL